jgi:hypothetical protein
MIQVLQLDLSFNLLIKNNAPKIRIRTSCLVNGRGAKDKNLHIN